MGKTEDKLFLKQIRFEHRLSQQELAQKIGVSKGYISLVELEKSALSQKVRDKILETFSNTSQKNSMEIIRAKLFLDVIGSCGGGAYVQSQEYELVEIPAYLVNKHGPNKEYSIITAKGESMEPFIKDNDKLIIEHCKDEQIIDNRVYIFCYQDNIFIKRLVRNLNELIIQSDNPDKNIYKTIHLIKEEMNDVYIIGQVVGIMRNIK